MNAAFGSKAKFFDWRLPVWRIGGCKGQDFIQIEPYDSIDIQHSAEFNAGTH